LFNLAIISVVESFRRKKIYNFIDYCCHFTIFWLLNFKLGTDFFYLCIMIVLCELVVKSAHHLSTQNKSLLSSPLGCYKFTKKSSIVLPAIGPKMSWTDLLLLFYSMCKYFIKNYVILDLIQLNRSSVIFKIPPQSFFNTPSKF
jgi:hypothetical protein